MHIMTDYLNPPVSPVNSHAIMAAAVTSAQAYDGSENGYRRLLDCLIAFEKCAQELVKNPALDHAQREAQLSEQLIKRSVTTQVLLGEALISFNTRLRDGKHTILVVKTGFAFLSSQGTSPVLTGSERGFDRGREEPRTAQLIKLLNEREIFVDDMVMYAGITASNSMRLLPYTLIQVPRLDREIVICDQVDEACYVGHGQRGPLFWATYQKEALHSIQGISRILDNERYEDNLLAALFQDNIVKPKIAVRALTNYPLNVDIILIKALQHTVLNKGKLPSYNSGVVLDMPEQTWSVWNDAIAHQYRGFDIRDLSGLGDLYKTYGLKIGRTENADVIQQALQSIAEKGHHGLKPTTKVVLTADFILGKALAYAAAHDGTLPTQKSGAVPDMPGQTWAAWDISIRTQQRGFDIKDLRGLGDLYEIYGLKIGRVENLCVVQQALKNIEEKGHYGLKPTTKVVLTADFILGKALAYAAAHDGNLPTQHSGAVPDMPGQNWAAWDQAIRGEGRGFDKKGLKGLRDLLNLYGLRKGRKQNIELIQKALQNIAQTKKHDLQIIEEMTTRPSSQSQGAGTPFVP